MNKAQIVIGISGKKQSGKDVVCKIIQQLVTPLYSQRIAFADALKTEVAKGCGVSELFIEANKEHFRLILQGWGTDFKRKLISENYWVEMYMRMLIGNYTPYIITPDVRFINEAQCIKNIGGYMIRIIRPLSEISNDKHESENGLQDFQFDYEISNNGSIITLKDKVEKIIKDINK